MSNLMLTFLKYVCIEPQSLTVLAKHDKIIGSFLTT